MKFYFTFILVLILTLLYYILLADKIDFAHLHKWLASIFETDFPLKSGPEFSTSIQINREEWRREQNLKTQVEIARSVRGAFFVAFAGLFLTSVGLFLLSRTLIETRRTLEATRALNDETRRANDLHVQERSALIQFEAIGPLFIEQFEDSSYFRLPFEIGNIGQTAATNIELNARIALLAQRNVTNTYKTICLGFRPTYIKAGGSRYNQFYLQAVGVQEWRDEFRRSIFNGSFEVSVIVEVQFDTIYKRECVLHQSWYGSLKRSRPGKNAWAEVALNGDSEPPKHERANQNIITDLRKRMQ